MREVAQEAALPLGTCLVCGAGNLNPLYRETLLRCGKCTFVTANMEVDADLLRSVYTNAYFAGEEYVDYLGDKTIQQMNFRRRLSEAERRAGRSALGNVLEIGCAYGFFAEVVTKESGAKCYRGYDIVPEAIEYGKSTLHQNVECVDYLTVAPGNPYTDVFMWDVIEHLPRPDLTIEKASAESSCGGRIYITTGDISSLLARLQGEKWRLVHPPSHLHYFTPKSITTLLGRYGYKVISISYPSTSRSLRLIFHSLFILRRAKPRRWLERIYAAIPERWYITMNTFDIMFVVAEKQ